MSRRLMTGQLPGGPVAATGQGMATGLPGGLPGRRVIAVLLLAAGTLDLARCGVAVASARDAGATAGLVVAGAAAAGLSLRTAQACEMPPALGGVGGTAHRGRLRTASRRVRLSLPLHDR